MSKLRLYIPTYRRTNRQITWSKLSNELRTRTTLVCPANEVGALRAATGGHVMAQPAHITTIAAKRQWIVDNCDSEFMCMLDDDLRLSVRHPTLGSGTDKTGRCALVQCGPRDVDTLFGEMEEQLQEVAHAGVSMRMGNQSRTPEWHSCKRMVYVLAYDVAVLRRWARFDEIAHREDMCVTLRLLQAGFENRVSFRFAADQVYNAKGGEAAAGRSMEASNADAERLASMFPDLVRVATKAYKVSAQRKEVVVSWSKAWASHLS